MCFMLNSLGLPTVSKSSFQLLQNILFLILPSVGEGEDESSHPNSPAACPGASGTRRPSRGL